MGITRDHGTYIQALLTPYLGAITVRGIDRKCLSSGNVLEAVIGPKPVTSQNLGTQDLGVECLGFRGTSGYIGFRIKGLGAPAVPFFIVHPQPLATASFQPRL